MTYCGNCGSKLDEACWTCSRCVHVRNLARFVPGTRHPADVIAFINAKWSDIERVGNAAGVETFDDPRRYGVVVRRGDAEVFIPYSKFRQPPAEAAPRQPAEPPATVRLAAWLQGHAAPGAD